MRGRAHCAAHGPEGRELDESNAQLHECAEFAESVHGDDQRCFVAMSVAFGIASVLSMSVVQRTREIGILRAMGARRGSY